MSTPVPALYVRPTYLTYGPEHGDALRKELGDLTKHTLATEVGDVKEMRLDPHGCLPEGYRFTSQGLKQVCELLGPGLFPFIRDLAGVDRAKETPREEYDFETAVRTYNRTLAIRFGTRFEGKQRLLRNLRDKLIEGVLGPRYQLVENSEVLDRAEESASNRPDGLNLQVAVLSGRRMMLRYTAAAKLFVVADSTGAPHAYRDGLHFANSEVGGESTFRAAPVLYHKVDESFALGAFLAGRQAHVGRKLQERMSRAFADAAEAQDGGRLAKRARTLMTLPLGLTGDPEADDARARAIASQLQTKGVPLTSGYKAVLASSAGSGRMPDFPSKGDAKVRTHFELFRSLAAHGRGLHATSQETVEQAAYALLVGQIKLR